MNRIVGFGIWLIVFWALTVPVRALEHDYAEHQEMAGMKTTAIAVHAEENLPPDEAQAKAALDKSPRHGEYVDIKLPGSEMPIRTWIVYPERKDKAPVILVIHEIYGLSDWIRALGDQIAKDGYIAVVPDLISGFGPGGGGTDSAKTRDEVVKLIRNLSPEETIKRLNAVFVFAQKIPAANGKVATVGYCWGGSQSFAYAVAQPKLGVAVVNYGSAPDPQDLVKIKAPVLGLYGGDDARVNATIDTTASEMKRLHKVYEYEIYEGAGHGFMRAQSGRDGANLRAARQAWPRMLAFLKKNL